MGASFGDGGGAGGSVGACDASEDGVGCGGDAVVEGVEGGGVG